MNKVCRDQADAERQGVAQRYRHPLHRLVLVFVVQVKYLLLDLEPQSAYERRPCFVRLALLEQFRCDLLADALAVGVSVCYVAFLY